MFSGGYSIWNRWYDSTTARARCLAKYYVPINVKPRIPPPPPGSTGKGGDKATTNCIVVSRPG